MLVKRGLGWLQEDRLKAEALLHSQKAGRGPAAVPQQLEPVLAQLRDKLVQDERSLRQQLTSLSTCLDVRLPAMPVPHVACCGPGDRLELAALNLIVGVVKSRRVYLTLLGWCRLQPVRSRSDVTRLDRRSGLLAVSFCGVARMGAWPGAGKAASCSVRTACATSSLSGCWHYLTERPAKPDEWGCFEIFFFSGCALLVEG